MTAHDPNDFLGVLSHDSDVLNAHPSAQSAQDEVLDAQFECAPAQQPAQPAQNPPYTAQQIADRYPDIGPSEVTVRTRWFPYLTQVAPEALLKEKGGYTQFAAELFDDFVANTKRGSVKPAGWVSSAKSRYSQEWESSGVIDGELMPEEVGGQLALSQNKLTRLTEETEKSQADLMELIRQTKAARSTLSRNEVERARQEGRNRAIEKYKVRLQAELETEAALSEALEDEV